MPACQQDEDGRDVADKSYVNTSVDAINQRILGRYQNGMGKTWDDPNHMKFFNDGAVNFPYLSDGMWFLTQHKRWGLLKDHPDYLAVAKQVNQIDLYKQAAAPCKIARAQGRDAHQQADGRRGLGRQGPEEIRRRFQDQGLNGPHSQEKHHGQCRLPLPLEAAHPCPHRIEASSPQPHNAPGAIAEKDLDAGNTGLEKRAEAAAAKAPSTGAAASWPCCRHCWAWACWSASGRW
jgi:hypothetical protein